MTDLSKRERVETEQLISSGEFERAIALLSTAINKGSVTAAAFARRAVAYECLGQLEAALADAARAADLLPSDPDHLCQKARLAAVLGHHEQACDAASVALDREQFNLMALRVRADARRAVGNLDGALADLNAAITLEPADADLHYCRGSIHLKRGDVAAALPDLRQAVQLSPDCAEHHRLAADAARLAGEFDLAARGYRRAIELAGDSEPALLGLAACLIDLNQLPSAITACDRAIAAGASAHDAWLLRAVALAKSGREQDAEADYRQAAERSTDDPTPRILLGESLAARGLYSQAIEAFSAAMEINPAAAAAWVGRGLVFDKLGQAEEALADFSRAVAASPNHGPARSAHGLALLRRGEFRAAHEDLSIAILLNPTDTTALTAHALILAAAPQQSLRDGALAVRNAGRACDLTGWKDAAALAALAAAAAETGDFEAAVASAVRALHLDATLDQITQIRGHLKRYEKHLPLRLEHLSG